MDDYDVDIRCDFVNALLSDFMKKREKDCKESGSCRRGCCRGDDGDEVHVSNFDGFFDRGAILKFHY